MKGLNNRNPWSLWGFRALMICTGMTASWGTLVAQAPISKMAIPQDISEAERRQKVHELYQKQIPLLEQYVEKYPQGPRVGQSMFRLGEAYFETAKYYQQLGQASRVSLYAQRAVQVLEKLRTLHPNYERIDEALLVLASTYLENSDAGKAGPILAEIADRFPNSPIMEQAAFLLGDFYFERGRYPQARRFYEKAAEIEKSKTYAHYKLAWVAIKENLPGVALKHFETVLTLSRAKKESFDYSSDAVREMVWPALEVHQSQGIVAYLEKALPEADLLEKSLESLAMGLNVRDEFKLASKIYDVLMAKFPQSPKSSDWLIALLEIEEKLGRSERIVALMSKMGSSGAQSSAELQTMIYSKAKKFHGLAQAEKDPLRKGQLYDQAIAFYQAFNQLGLDNAKARETQFYYGEALYARGRYPEALAAYKIAASGNNDKELDAVWNAYLTAEKMAPSFQHTGKEKKALESRDEDFLISAKLVAENERMPMDKRRLATYQSARLLYQVNDYDRALPLFQALAEKHAGTKEAELSAQLVLDIFNLRNDYQAVARYAREYQSSASGGLKTELSSVEQRAAFKAIQEAELTAKGASESSKPGELKEVAQKYLRFASDYPSSTLVDASIWAAIQLHANAADLLKDQEFGELRASFQKLIREYPQSKFVPEAVNLLGSFLADREKLDESSVAVYRDYRAPWLKMMRAQPAGNRGRLGMLVYKLSDENQKRELEREFSKLPYSSDNRIPLAYGKRHQMIQLKDQFDTVSLNSLKTLKANTKTKLARLEKFQDEVTKFLELGVPELSVEVLELLAQAYSGMAFSLREAPIPSSIEGENLVKYRTAVDEQAKVFDDKAQKTRDLKEKARAKAGI